MASPNPKRVGTLSDLVTQRRSLVLYCMTTGCPATGREVDIAKIIRERGDMLLQEFAELSVCQLCGAREPKTVCAPIDVGPNSGWG